MGKDIEVIWDTTHPVEPYIMAMYPDQEELHKKSKELFDLLVDADGVKTKTPSKSIPYDKYTEKWCEIQHWQLYIDIRLITESGLFKTILKCNVLIKTGSAIFRTKKLLERSILCNHQPVS